MERAMLGVSLLIIISLNVSTAGAQAFLIDYHKENGL
jgi:hypothetical protein